MSTTVGPRTEYDPSHFAWIHDTEERHFWFRARGEIIASLMASLISTYANAPNVLEVGCGSGIVLRDLAKLPRGRFFGMDLFSEGFAAARRRSSIPLLQADLHRLPFGRDFDLLCLFDVLEHIENDVEVLTDFAQLLRPGGRLVLTVPAYPALWSYADEIAHHIRRYTASSLSEAITRAGLEVEYLSPFMACLLPLMSIGRLVNARRAGDRAAPERIKELYNADLRVRPIINGVLYQILRQEKRLLGRRWRLPFGTSFLVVARSG